LLKNIIWTCSTSSEFIETTTLWSSGEHDTKENLLCQVMNFSFLFPGLEWDWVHLVRRPLIGLLCQPRMIDGYGAIGGIRIDRGNRSTRRKPAPVPLCPLQIPHDLTWVRTRAAAVGSQQQTAWAMAQPRRWFYTQTMIQYLWASQCPSDLCLVVICKK
jgi:hypothetical protein